MGKSVSDAFSEFYFQLIGVFPTLLFAILIFIIIAGLGHIGSRIWERRLRKKKREPIVQIFFVNVLRWFFYLLGLITALDILGLSGVLGGMIAGASISAIIIGFAFKDIAENFLSGILLAFSKPFRLGDIVEVDKFRGRVRNIKTRTTTIRTGDGREVILPNAMLIKNPVTNFTKDGLMRYQFSFGVDTPTPTDRVRSIIMNYLFSEPDILNEPRPNVNLVEINSTDVTIRVAFWVNLFREKKTNRVDLGEPILNKVMDRVKELMLENNINMPGQIIELKSYRDTDPVFIKNV